MTLADRKRVAQLLARANVLAARQIELTQEVGATRARAAATLKRVQAQAAAAQRASRSTPR